MDDRGMDRYIVHVAPKGNLQPFAKGVAERFIVVFGNKLIHPAKMKSEFELLKIRGDIFQIKVEGLILRRSQMNAVKAICLRRIINELPSIGFGGDRLHPVRVFNAYFVHCKIHATHRLS
jgi:hypothetical protein